MIPNIFISSTIADLNYLRDALRDAVEDLAYHPVMSEYGEVGYLNPTTAAESCYRSVRQCQMVVLIIGKRYGHIGDDGLSITHREFRASQEEQLPTITLVESQVLHYKEVYEADREAVMWKTFKPMDAATSTFSFLDDVSKSQAYNAIVPFTSVADAKRKLKLQLADFVGDRLTEAVPQMGQNLREVLAEIKTLRNQITHSSPNLQLKESDSKRYLIVTLFLLNENNTDYRRFLEHLFGDIDSAIEIVPDCATFTDVLSQAGYSYEMQPLEAIRSTFLSNEDDIPHELRPQQAAFSGRGGYVFYPDKRIAFTQNMFARFTDGQHALRAKLAVR